MKTADAIDLTKIKAIFFDAGGTLFRPFPSVGEVYSEVASRHGLFADPLELEATFHTHWEERDGLASLQSHSSEKKEKEWWKTLVWDVFSRFGELKDFDAFFEELYHRFASPEVWRLFPDVLPSLKELKRKRKILGVVSNWDSRLFGICRDLGLNDYFDFVLASAVVGSAKPSPKIFQEALKHAQVEPGEALHVGDSIEDDILGAQKAGVHALFLDRKGRRSSNALTVSTLLVLAKDFIDRNS
ncbi:MAG: HAD-IA family hydrolase [Candidatus Omnitrophica bacterium]|nr:HAD-IA family hydrolase [Candidatus Omnitrophota bacterium]